MPASTLCYTLLRTRLTRFTRQIHRLERGQVGAVQDARIAARQLRDLLPLLPLDHADVRKTRVRLRKMRRRLARVHDLDRAQRLADRLDVTDRPTRDGLARVKDELRLRRGRTRPGHIVKKSAADGARIAERLDRMLDALDEVPDDRLRMRAVVWALKARIARRASDAKSALRSAGAVYLPDRLDSARNAIRKLRDGLELLFELNHAPVAPDLRVLSRGLEQLGRLSDTQLLVDRVRKVQGTLTPPDLKVWKSLDALVTALEHRSRRLHAGYVQDRDALLAACDRLSGRMTAGTSAKRKVG
jgi:CHAD domain-containing protein